MQKNDNGPPFNNILNATHSARLYNRDNDNFIVESEIHLLPISEIKCRLMKSTNY